jgi:hypothetical protein
MPSMRAALLVKGVAGALCQWLNILSQEGTGRFSSRAGAGEGVSVMDICDEAGCHYHDLSKRVTASNAASLRCFQSPLSNW